jgi:hypothetical protein
MNNVYPQTSPTLLSPDAKQSQVPPNDANDGAILYFDIGAIIPDERKAISARTDISHEVLNAENKNSRRMKDGMKNLLRAIVTKLKANVRWVMSNPTKAIATLVYFIVRACKLVEKAVRILVSMSEFINDYF